MEQITVQIANLNRSNAAALERLVLGFPGVRSIDTWDGKAVIRVEQGTAADQVVEKMRAAGYLAEIHSRESACCSVPKRLSAKQIAGVFGLAALLMFIFSKAGLIKADIGVAATFGIGSAFVLGIVAAASSCIAVSGGILISVIASFNAKNTDGQKRFLPTALFVLGRIASYAFFGGLIGLAGTALTLSPAATGAITFAAALAMIVLGLDFLSLVPKRLKKIVPKMPKAISEKLIKPHASNVLAPFLLGAATFFLPCGFTQSLQLFALTLKNPWLGAGILGAFAVGTAPSLLAIGWVSARAKGGAGKFIHAFSGALIVILGILNIQNGLTLVGHPLPVWGTAHGSAADSNGGEQVIRMSVGSSGYSPASFTIKAGLPTKWEINGDGIVGCESVLVSQSLGIQKNLVKGPNTIEFTAPQKTGTYAFSCSMGMYRGTIKVVNS